MIYFKAEIEHFEQMGDKTGWNYVFIPASIAREIKPNCRTSFRVKGKIDDVEIAGMATIPMGAGDFIIALRSELRKKLNKKAGAAVEIGLEEDKDFKIDMPEDLEMCLMEEEHLMSFFLSFAKSHQNYFIKWINEAKTEVTRTKRLAMTITAMYKKQDFGAMMRGNKANK